MPLCVCAYTTINICTCTHREYNQQSLNSSEGAGFEGHMFFLWIPFSVYTLRQSICPRVLVLRGHTISLSQEAPEYPV